jgi:streptomycin 6-kinase
MNDSSGPTYDLTTERLIAEECARTWGIDLDPPFDMSNFSYVAPTTDGAVLKVAWSGDDESLHEAEALEVWNGDGAVRVLRRSGRTLLEERAIPGDDLSELPDGAATSIAIDIAHRLWRPAMAPFRPVDPEVSQWLSRAEGEGSVLVPLARTLFEEIGGNADWLVHGDFHHHNIVRSGQKYVAIDPKPYLADREYDVPAFLWNPRGNLLTDAAQTQRRIAAFADAGLDEYKIRAWTVIRGSYLRSGGEYVEPLRSLIDQST